MMNETPQPELQPNVARLRPTVANASKAGEAGLVFKHVDAAQCNICKASIPAGTAKPLSMATCPACSGKTMMPARLGGFLIYDRLGEGEMGTVYRATDESLHRDVAIKLVRLGNNEGPQGLERLRQEARAAGRINHPRVAQVHALNFSNGHPYLVMELVTGDDLAVILAKQGALDERSVLKVAIEASEGLSALNRENLVHGDIKPSNIVLDRDGHVKLVDFGLSGMSRFDSDGRLIGTPDYIAPELLKHGKDSHYSDLYSLGATLYHLRAGRPPFEGATPTDVVRARLTQQPALLSSIAPGTSYGTSNLIMRMMESNPLKRPDNSAAVAREAQQILVQLDCVPVVKISAMKRFWEGLARVMTAIAANFTIASAPRTSLRVLLLLAILVTVISIGMRNGSFTAIAAMAQRKLVPSITKYMAANEPPAPPVAPAPREELPLVQAALLPPYESPSTIATATYTRQITPIWQSVELGDASKRGGTIQVGDSLIFQGTGENMWSGVDHCRFVWTSIAGDYLILTRVIAIADTHDLALSGLLLKGEDIAASDGLYFGFLGNGEVALQARLATSLTKVIRRSKNAVRRPVWLMVARRGQSFEAKISDDGHAWRLFAACELPLSGRNSIGFIVSANSREALATANFADIRVRAPGESAAPANVTPATAEQNN